MSRKAVLLLVALVLCAVPALAESKNSNVKIVNKSEWSIHHFFLSSSESEEWGPDQLGENTIESGGSFTLQNIPCDTYDVKLIDEDGDECVVEQVDVCSGQQEWEVTSKDLAQCQGYGG